ncbi:hypothetical protein RBWH47_02974 [Rhodopirellula baltica WH47]|uniref:Uncharacterized protein n=1 Tax=Rhodopirellula baltica WH47 TaxID=991778 RepID=F2AUN6_RHOBT|nr:hypothetical protein RBWH47_02974 [Rhodopirellula baltica WH47]
MESSPDLAGETNRELSVAACWTAFRGSAESRGTAEIATFGRV